MWSKLSALNPVVLLFISGAVLSWGLYVPVVHEATLKLQSNLRAFLMVGIAYFLVAVLVPCLFIFGMGDPTAKANPNFNGGPVAWGIAAGVAGALGALCVIFAVNKAGPGGAFLVAPLVFAGAPIVNTIATITVFHPVKQMPSPFFFLGLLLAAVGAAMVMLNKPETPKAPPAAPAVTAVQTPAQH